MIDSGEGAPRGGDFTRNKQMVENSAIVKNHLLNPVFACYYMGWKNLVNPQSKNASILYHGMGPDASTALLSTNATEITSIDPKHPSAEELNTYLKHWDTIDTDLYNLPGKLSVMEQSIIDNPSEANLNAYLRGILTNKEQSGHWDSLDISALGVSRSLLIELKKMGVDRTSIHVAGEGTSTTLSFDWSYPGEQPKKRVLRFGIDYIDPILSGESYPDKKFDGFYEKSIMEGTLMNDRKSLMGLLDRLTDNAFLLIGANRRAQSNITDNIGVSPLSISPEYNASVLTAMPHLQNGYTWQLNGYKKTMVK